MKSHSYVYPRPALTVDAVVFRKSKVKTEVLLIERAHEPFQGCHAFPGGFVDEGEAVEMAVERELQEETGLINIKLKQVYVASKPNRDPRGWTVSVIFLGEIFEGQTAKAGDDAAELGWFDIEKLPNLAFDHKEILEKLIHQF